MSSLTKFSIFDIKTKANLSYSQVEFIIAALFWFRYTYVLFNLSNYRKQHVGIKWVHYRHGCIIIILFNHVLFLYAKSRKLFENYSNKKTVEIRLVCFCLKSPMVGYLPSFWNDVSIPAMVEKWIKLYKRLKLFRLNRINSKVNSRFYLSSTFLFKSY